MVHFVHNIRYRLLSQFGNGVHGSKLHFFVYGFSVHIKSTSKDIGETNNVVNLVWIIGPSSRHNNVWSCFYRIFVRNLRHRVSQRKYDRIAVHRQYHLF